MYELQFLYLLYINPLCQKAKFCGKCIKSNFVKGHNCNNS